jgi:7-cyano-7-deazaguanine synthase in queuosine biosynthesis
MHEIQVDKTKNYIHLFSGGLDSTYALLKLVTDVYKGKKEKHQIQTIFIDYGQHVAQYEGESVQDVTNFIRSILGETDFLLDPIHISLRSDLLTWCNNVAFTGKEVGDETCEIQNRNMILVSIAASYLMACAENQGIEMTIFKIYSGLKDGEMPDSNRHFFDRLEELLHEYKGQYPIKVELIPKWSRDKICGEIKRLLKGNEAQLKQLLALTVSCYSPIDGRKPCGDCLKCRMMKQEKKFARLSGLS